MRTIIKVVSGTHVVAGNASLASPASPSQGATADGHFRTLLRRCRDGGERCMR